jgi:Tol biopolymer transport system component
MNLAAGARFGPYEIAGLVGAGGVGAVYRARDSRLGRDVAVKVLTDAVGTDPERLRRFEQEARAAGQLNHPNILTVFDVGAHDGVPYVVAELLEGETLRESLRQGSLPLRKALDYAGQIARGLAAAHEKGIVHRDLKPENLFITKDGRLKILDFGLAKVRVTPAFRGDAATESLAADAPATEKGTILGTVGYMSPEQVRGLAADHRADIFALGAILYEMAAGQRAFLRDTAAETMTAILKEEPPEIAEGATSLPAPLARVVRRCLEKRPEERFDSARDVGFALEAVSGTSGSVSAVAAAVSARRRWLPLALAALAVTVALAGGFALGQRQAGRPGPPTLQRLTFRRGTAFSARFAPDGQTIVFGAAWEGRPSELFSTLPGGKEARPLGLAASDIFSISPTGEMALCRGLRGPWDCSGTLTRASLAGGEPRDVLEDVISADWLPDGSELAVVRDVAGKRTVECPPGKVLYETSAYAYLLRVSPDGQWLAFIESRHTYAATETVVLLDRQGQKRELSSGWQTTGLAWSPSGDALWLSGGKDVAAGDLYAIDLQGRERLLARFPGLAILRDVARDGRVLLTSGSLRMSLMRGTPGSEREQDLSWLDSSTLADLSPDGTTLFFSEVQEGGGRSGGAYLRKADGSPAVRLGDGDAQALSPDGKWAIVLTREEPQEYVLVPTGPGVARKLPRGNVNLMEGIGWFPDGRRILFRGSEPNHGVRSYVQDVETGALRAITPDGLRLSRFLSPDGRFSPVVGKPQLYPVDGGEPRVIPGYEDGDIPVGWSADSKSLYVAANGLLIAVFRLDIATGRRTHWLDLAPADRAGVTEIPTVRVARDGWSYAYTVQRMLSDLYLVQGLK